MSLPDTGTVSVLGGNDLPKAFLTKLPPHVWKMFADSNQNKENFKISLDNGEFKLITPTGESISMGAHTTGVPTEIHGMNASGTTLQPIALATARLTAPMAGPAPKSGGHKPMTALLAKSSAATSMSRTQSSPAVTGATTPAVSPKIPLKTRVIQLLAFGNFSEAQIATKLDSPAADVMRVVNVLCRQTGSASPPVYELLPTQYSKVKINDWTYTGIEKKIVIKRARKAFDELELPPGADERVEMDKKEKESINIRANSSGSPPETSAALPAKVSPLWASRILPDGTKLSDMPPIKKIKKQPEVESDKAAVPKSAKPASDKPSDTVGRAIKKAKPTAKTAFGKELEKHRAGKRGTSMPNGKREGGVASPRPATKSTLSSKPTTSKSKSGKLSINERLKRSAFYSDTDSDSESEDDKPSPPKKVKALPTTSASAPTSAPAPQKPSPMLIALGLALFGPEAEAEEAAQVAAAAAAEAEAAVEAASKAKAKAEAAAAKAAAMAQALKKRPAENDHRSNTNTDRRSNSTTNTNTNNSAFPKKARISPNLALLGLPARPLEDCQIIDTNPLRAEPIARPRTGSQPSNGSHGSPYINANGQLMNRSQSSNGSGGAGSQAMNRSLNGSTQSSFTNAPSPLLPSHLQEMRERWQQIYPAYKDLANQLRDYHVMSRDVKGRMNNNTPDVEAFKRLSARYEGMHAELAAIECHFGGISP